VLRLDSCPILCAPTRRTFPASDPGSKNAPNATTHIALTVCGQPIHVLGRFLAEMQAQHPAFPALTSFPLDISTPIPQNTGRAADFGSKRSQKKRVFTKPTRSQSRVGEEWISSADVYDDRLFGRRRHQSWFLSKSKSFQMIYLSYLCILSLVLLRDPNIGGSRKLFRMGLWLALGQSCSASLDYD
jgi:hypothetical protein